MRKTIYSVTLQSKNESYWYGDLPFRLISTIVHVIEFGFIIYLLVR